MYLASISGGTQEAASQRRQVWEVEVSGIEIRLQALVKRQALRQVPRRAQRVVANY